MIRFLLLLSVSVVTNISAQDGTITQDNAERLPRAVDSDTQESLVFGPITTGFAVHEGLYVSPPYRISIDIDGVKLNGIMFSSATSKGDTDRDREPADPGPYEWEDERYDQYVMDMMFQVNAIKRFLSWRASHGWQEAERMIISYVREQERVLRVKVAEDDQHLRIHYETEELTDTVKITKPPSRRNEAPKESQTDYLEELRRIHDIPAEYKSHFATVEQAKRFLAAWKLQSALSREYLVWRKSRVSTLSMSERTARAALRRLLVAPKSGVTVKEKTSQIQNAFGVPENQAKRFLESGLNLRTFRQRLDKQAKK